MQSDQGVIMDDAGLAQQDNEQHERARNSRFDAAEPYRPPKGKAGNCDLCGAWSGRLVEGACAQCRDKYKLP